MELSITRAGLSDLPAVGALYGDVCDALQGRPYNPGWRRGGFPTVGNARAYLAGGLLLLAHAGGRLAGSLALTASPSAEEDSGPSAQEPGIWYIHVVAVHPGFQRMGVSARLLSAAGEQARQAGIHTLRLFVWEGNAPAIRAYEKAGFACVRQGVDIGLAEFGLARFSLYEKAA